MLNKLPKHLLKYINEFVEPTDDQLEIWKMNHYVDGYYKVLKDIEDIITEIKIGRNGNMKCYFSLFSWSLLDTEFFFDYSYTDEENDDNLSLVIS
tara:strand:+ start:234 stop:518 length:285 start_codon:yes stop_codon:yes gene_type:complete